MSVETRRNPLARFFGVLLRDRFAFVGTLIYLIFLAVAAFAPLLAPHDPLEFQFRDDGRLARNIPPGDERFPLGTTSSGYDILSQLLHGTRSALIVGVSAAFFVVAIGTLIGLLAGYFGGVLEVVLMRITDIAFGIPFLPFVIILSAFLEPGVWNIVLAMSLILWRDTARVIRSQVLTVRQRAFVEAARVTGSGHARILFLHVAPNILPLSFLYGSIAVGWAILTEASVAFLGFGDSTVVSWGGMLQDAYQSQALSRGMYHWFVPPGLAIILVVVAGFFISRGYEEILFPKLEEG
jgi:peptide/nickel transport system permease protein